MAKAFWLHNQGPRLGTPARQAGPFVTLLRLIMIVGLVASWLYLNYGTPERLCMSNASSPYLCLIDPHKLIEPDHVWDTGPLFDSGI